MANTKKLVKKGKNKGTVPKSKRTVAVKKHVASENAGRDIGMGNEITLYTDKRVLVPDGPEYSIGSTRVGVISEFSVGISSIGNLVLPDGCQFISLSIPALKSFEDIFVCGDYVIHIHTYNLMSGVHNIAYTLDNIYNQIIYELTLFMLETKHRLSASKLDDYVLTASARNFIKRVYELNRSEIEKDFTHLWGK